MTKLLIAHEGESNARLERNLAEYGIDCVSFEPSSRVYRPEKGLDIEVDVGFVYPGRVIEGGVVDALLDINWINGLKDILKTRNKAHCLTELERSGIRVPKTRLVSNPSDESDVIETLYEVGTPAIIKPNSTTRGRGVIKVDNEDSLSGVSDLFSVLHESSLVFDRTFLVQEFIEDAHDYRIMTIGGEFVGAVERSADGWKHNVHRGAVPTKTTPSEEIIGLAEETSRVLDLDICGVDILAGERVVVNEVNGRPTIDTSDKYEDNFYPKLAKIIKSRV